MLTGFLRNDSTPVDTTTSIARHHFAIVAPYHILTVIKMINVLYVRIAIVVVVLRVVAAHRRHADAGSNVVFVNALLPFNTPMCCTTVPKAIVCYMKI